MSYEEFIGEVRHVIREGSEMLEAGVDSHEHPAFRAWRHAAQSLVANIRAQGFALPGAFKSHQRMYRAPWVHAGRIDDGDRFRRDMNDSLIELQYLVDQFDTYGAPRPAPGVTRQAAPAGKPDEGISAEKITLSWVRNHVPFSFWAWAIALYAATFVVGFLAGRNDFLRKTYDLVQETFVSDSKRQ
jgi:hypothetical protein